MLKVRNKLLFRPGNMVRFECAVPSLQLVTALGVTAGLSSFQDGYYLGVINNPADTLQAFMNSSFHDHYDYYLSKSESTALWAFIVALYTVGGILGSWSTLWLVDKLGRKWTIMVFNNVIALVACSMFGLCKLANSWELLAVSRFLIGYNAGLATGALGIFLTECSPVKFRGFFGSFMNTAVTFFNLVSVIISLDTIMGTETLWPYLFGMGIIPAVIQIIISPFFPETPKYLLLAKKDEIAAQKSVLYYFGPGADVESTFKEFRHEERLARNQVGFFEALRDERYRFPIILSSVINIAQVSTGIIAIFSYSSTIFESVGFPSDQAQIVTAIMTSFNAVGSIFGLLLIETWGRRPLMLWGTLICLLCDVVVMFFDFGYNETGNSALGYICAGALVLHVTVFNMGVGPIAWFISSELMPQSARSIGASVSVTVNWTVALITSLTFDPLNNAVKGWSFLLFIIPVVPCLIYMWLKVPETKNKHVDEIMATWIKPAETC